MLARTQTLQLQPPSTTLSQAALTSASPQPVRVSEPTPSSSVLLVLTFCVWLLRQRNV